MLLCGCIDFQQSAGIFGVKVFIPLLECRQPLNLTPTRQFAGKCELCVTDGYFSNFTTKQVFNKKMVETCQVVVLSIIYLIW